MKKSLLLVALSVCLLPLWGQQNFSRIDSLIKKMLPEASEVGISVYDLTAKKSLYNYRAEKLSRPASTMKLLTAITALSRPEANEPFRTEVWHDGVIEHDTLQGNLYVVGGFDPEFNSQSMDSLIEEVITFPFSVINGQVYGDVSMKDSLYWGSGWAWDDTPAGYQPYLSPLMFCKGTVQVSVVPSTVQGDTASVSCQPVSSYYTVTNQTKTRTSSAGRFSFTRDWLTNGNNLLVSGNVTSIRKDDVNIYDSPRFFMHTFLERLRGKGITTPQSYGFAELPRDSVNVERMACWNTSVQKVLNQLMKESDNLNAEAFLCRLGARGQAWAIYGYTVVYRETKDPKYLDFAQKVTDVYLERLPEDKVPYWDFSAPGIPDAPRDASAAAVVASALLELSTYLPNGTGKRYKDAAIEMLASLNSDSYQSGKSKPSFLLHSVGHWPAHSEIDASIIYADYYYIEALLRLKRLQEGHGVLG